MGAVQFYHLDGRDWQGDVRLAHARRPGDYAASFWQPSFGAPFPPGRRDPRILSYSAMHALGLFRNADSAMEIGRASCRERGCRYVWILEGAVSLKKKK